MEHDLLNSQSSDRYEERSDLRYEWGSPEVRLPSYTQHCSPQVFVSQAEITQKTHYQATHSVRYRATIIWLVIHITYGMYSMDWKKNVFIISLISGSRFIYNFISKLSLSPSLDELYNIPIWAKLVILLPGLVKSIWIMFFNGSTVLVHSPN